MLGYAMLTLSAGGVTLPDYTRKLKVEKTKFHFFKSVFIISLIQHYPCEKLYVLRKISQLTKQLCQV